MFFCSTIRTFAGLVVLDAVGVQENATVTVELLSLWRGSQLSYAGLGQGLLLFTRHPAEENGAKQCQMKTANAGGKSQRSK